MSNLVDRPECAGLRAELDARLRRRLEAIRDDFLPGREYMRRFGYATNETGAVPYQR